MAKSHYLLALLVFCLLAVSCNRQAPQLPSNKGNIPDKSAASMLVINQNLAKKEDVLLRNFALRKDRTFKRTDTGFWYKIDQQGNGARLEDSVACTVSYKVLSLQGKLLQADEKQIVIGKKQVVTGLEEGLKLLNKGASATIIVPWYLAYGMKGNEPTIPPYTSVVYILKVYN